MIKRYGVFRPMRLGRPPQLSNIAWRRVLAAIQSEREPPEPSVPRVFIDADGSVLLDTDGRVLLAR